MASGGARQGAAQKAYAQRKDLNRAKQPLRVVPDQTYGQGAASLDAQKAVPLPNNTNPPPPQPIPAAQMGDTSGQPMYVPGQQGDFLRATERPNEPVTAGLNSAPVITPMEDPNITQLRAIYNAHPNNDLLKMIGLLTQ